jgi:methionyl-tRNA synthetase
LFGEQATETVTDSLGKHTVLRYLPETATGKWEPGQLPPGQKLQQPAPLFKKLDDEIVEQERSRLGK